MTRRERLERKMEKRETWAGKAAAESDRRFDTAHKLVEGIPLGQPILVGHHSEKRHRRTLDRMASNMDKGCEAADRAKDHTSKAAGIEHQLDVSIFDDDPDAVEKLTERIAVREAQAERCVAMNKALRPLCKKAGGAR